MQSWLPTRFEMELYYAVELIAEVNFVKILLVLFFFHFKRKIFKGF